MKANRSEKTVYPKITEIETDRNRTRFYKIV